MKYKLKRPKMTPAASLWANLKKLLGFYVFTVVSIVVVTFAFLKQAFDVILLSLLVNRYSVAVGLLISLAVLLAFKLL